MRDARCAQPCALSSRSRRPPRSSAPGSSGRCSSGSPLRSSPATPRSRARAPRPRARRSPRCSSAWTPAPTPRAPRSRPRCSMPCTPARTRASCTPTRSSSCTSRPARASRRPPSRSPATRSCRSRATTAPTRSTLRTGAGCRTPRRRCGRRASTARSSTSAPARPDGARWSPRCEQLTGVRIDHFAEIGMAGFVELTEALGGVPVCLNAPVRDSYSGVDLPAGEQPGQRRERARVRPPAARALRRRPRPHRPPAGLRRRPGAARARAEHAHRSRAAAASGRHRDALRRARPRLGPRPGPLPDAPGHRRRTHVPHHSRPAAPTCAPRSTGSPWRSTATPCGRSSGR